MNTDAIDNAAGVDCSDHEVNIKVLLDAAARSGMITGNARNRLLVDMTDEVAQLVLANNQAHNRLLSDARSNAAQMIDVHARMTADLEARRGLHRTRENMPSPAEFADLAKEGCGLTAPQLATLMAHVKLDLKAELLSGAMFDDPYFVALLNRYFPPTLRRQLGEPLPEHPLRREIITTSIVNRVLATSGLTFTFRLSEETGSAPADIVRAHAVASEVFDLDTLWSDIYAADLSPALTNAMIIEGRRLLDRAARWFVLNRPQPLDVDAEITRFSNQVAMLRGQLGSMLRGQERDTVLAAHDDLVARGVPADIARRISESLYAFSLLDIIEVAHVHGENSAQLASIYFELSDRLGVDRLLLAVSSLPEVAAGMRRPGLPFGRTCTARCVISRSTSPSTGSRAPRPQAASSTSRPTTARGWTGPSARWTSSSIPTRPIWRSCRWPQPSCAGSIGEPGSAHGDGGLSSHRKVDRVGDEAHPVRFVM